MYLCVMIWLRQEGDTCSIYKRVWVSVNVYVRGCDKSTSKIQHCAGETQKQTKTQTRKIIVSNGLSCQNNCYTKWIVERVETLHKQKRVKQNLEETLGVTTITRQKTTDNKVAHRSNVKIHVQERRHARRFRLWLCFGFMFGFTRGFALYVLFQGRFETRNKYIRHGPIDGWYAWDTHTCIVEQWTKQGGHFLRLLSKVWRYETDRGGHTVWLYVCDGSLGWRFEKGFWMFLCFRVCWWALFKRVYIWALHFCLRCNLHLFFNGATWVLCVLVILVLFTKHVLSTLKVFEIT